MVNPEVVECRGDIVFTCISGKTICDVQECDGTRDCPDGDDEVNCPLLPTTTEATTTAATTTTTTTTTTTSTTTTLPPPLSKKI